MAHPQNSPRGLFAKNSVAVGAATLTADSTGNLVLSGGIKLNNVQTVKSNSTGALVIGAPLAALPSTDQGIAWGVLSNSTGVGIVVNSTGTTWKYLLTTSVQPK